MQRLSIKASTLSANINVTYRGQQKIVINKHSHTSEKQHDE
jgi:hypothetical protein